MNDGGNRAVKQPLPRWRVSPVWLVPLGALLVGIWLAYRTISSLGPEVVLELSTAEGLEPNRTVVKLHDVKVGLVEKVNLTSDYGGVLATVRMDPETAPLLVKDTQFWVVKPRVGRRGISGLETIISGAYIQIRPGQSRESARRFKVLEQPPPTLSGAPGLSLMLVNDGSEALAVDDPVLHQGQMVGRVTSATFDLETKKTRYGILVESPYDKLVTRNSQFWSRSGIDVRLTAEGIDMRLGPLQTLLTGGVGFDNPAGEPPGQPARDGDEYRLFGSQQAADQARFDLRIEYLVLFDGSVHGLHAGAPVDFRGVRVGTVSKVPYLAAGLRPDSLKRSRVPVLISFEPQRVGGSWSRISREEWMRRLTEQFDDGLRATISPANLLTGARHVSLEFVDDAAHPGTLQTAGHPVFPSHGGASGIGPVLNRLETTLATADEMLRDAQGAARRIDSLFSADKTRNLPAELQATLRDIRKTLVAYQRGQPAYESLQRNLQRLSRVLDNLESFSRTVSEDPNALLFGREDDDARPPGPAPHSEGR